MSLTAVARFIKKYTGVLIALVVIPTLLVVIIVIYKNRIDSQLPILNEPTLALFSPKIEGINTQNLKEPQNLPTRLPVYSINQNADYLKNNGPLASKFGFTKSPIQTNDANLGQGYIYVDENNVLSIYKNSVAYQKLNLKPQPGNFDKNKAAEIAKSYLLNLGLDTSTLAVTGSTLESIEGDYILETLDPQKASFIKLDFGYTLSGIRTVASQLVINASVDIYEQITAFNFRALGDTQPLDKYPLTTYKDAIQALTGGKGKVISMEGLGGYASQLTDLQKVDATDVYLAYFLPANPQEPLQPVWVFEGQTTVKNSTAKIKIAIPAIQERFFKKS